MESRDQLAFWPIGPVGRAIVSNDVIVPLAASRGGLPRRDDVVVTDDRRTYERREALRSIIFISGASDWTSEKSKQQYLLANATPVSIAALLRIAFAQRETLSLARMPVAEQKITRLLVGDLEQGKVRQAKWLASSLMRLSQDVFRYDLVQAWTRAVSRPDDKSEPFTIHSERPDHFVPSPSLVQFVRDGLRSHSENYPRLIEPRFVPAGIALLTDQDISEFIAVRMWRLMLSLADHAMAEGENKGQLGNESGFLDKIDHLILDRIPVSPKNVTPFLNTLYEEYKRFAEWGQALPERGKLWSDERGLFFNLDGVAFESTENDGTNNQKTEVIFE
jgi:hypothetical protein